MPEPVPSTASRLPGVVGTGLRLQVAFFGPLGVGKSTAVSAASSIPVTGTEAPWSMAERYGAVPGGKTTTTVGIEYGEWRPDDGPTVAIYGTPGQLRFDDVRQSVVTHNGGIVLWLFGNGPAALTEARMWLRGLLGQPGTAPPGRLLVAVTRLDDDRDLAAFEEVVAEFDPTAPVLRVDPRDRDDVRTALRRLVGGSR